MGFFEDLTDNISNVVQDFAKNPIAFTVDKALFGVTGLRGITEGIGELTGRNAMRGALNDQRNAMQKNMEDQQRLMNDEQKRRNQEDLIASRAAGAMQNRAVQSIGVGSGSSYSTDGTNKFNSADLYLGGL